MCNLIQVFDEIGNVLTEIHLHQKSSVLVSGLIDIVEVTVKTLLKFTHILITC
jgi:hypothetical protein